MQVGTGDRKPQSPAEILRGFTKQKKEKPPVPTAPLTPELTPITNHHHHHLLQQTVKLQPKASNLSEILSGNKNRNRNQPNSNSLIVTLKLPQRENFKSLPVTLKSSKLKTQQRINPTQSSHPFFQAVNERLQRKSESNTKDISTIKAVSLDPPRITKHYFKISHSSSESYNFTSLDLPLKHRIQPSTSFIPTTFDFLILYTNYREIKKPKCIPDYTITTDNNPQLATQLLNQRYGKLLEDFRFAKFFDPSYTSSLKSDNIQQWCDLYKPLSHLESLQQEHISNDVANWVSVAFSKLKKVNQFKRKQNLSNSKKITKELDSFIVYSDDESLSDTDDFNTHVPSLIIQGPIGCGKSNMIHTIVKEELNGHVFEFNSSQPRARKELEFNLKQIGTTSLVQKSSQISTDNSVILFDDVDLIDESNGDKDFWLGAQDLLTYSYRPVIFITSDLKNIPANILEESTVYKFEKIQKKIIHTYIDMIALSRGFNFDFKILKELSEFDLRKSLMELQLLSYHFDTPNMGLVNVTILQDEKMEDNIDNELTQLEKLENKLLLMDTTYYIEQVNKNSITYISSDDQKHEYDGPSDATIRENFKIDQIACLEFYSSKYFSNGSRSKICRYVNGEQYNKKHPNNVFQYLPRDKLATDILPLIHELAKWELGRATYNYPRLFDMHPLDAFEGLS
ncbi:hypothetical protein CANINC_003824 [Pichia inconspicua]|uniref:AAA+ ATPase domain-containing protein n=1 Tax=Pichia inconspicua TaxID=52247 RepID=A0A4T0WY07_9ASCO|nr:hypothetical protein CANINC_003824 [[Candida] inconspicua]